MKVGDAIAEIMKREGIELLFGYPVNHLIEFAAKADIRPIMVRQERVGLHMADAISRLSSGRKIGAFCMQHGPGTENAYGGVAQAFGESVPILVLPMGYPRRLAHVSPNYNPVQSMSSVTKSAEPIMLAAEVPNILRRAFTRLRNGRGGPVLVEIPNDMWNEEVPEPLDYTPVFATRYGPDPEDARRAARLLAEARRPVIYAGQGVHYARAWPQLRALAELARRPGCHQPRRQEFVSREPSAGPRLGRRRVPQDGAPLPAFGRRHHRHRLQLHRDHIRRSRCPRASGSSTPRSIPTI